jgi:hypothetical protein
MLVPQARVGKLTIEQIDEGRKAQDLRDIRNEPLAINRESSRT